MRESIPMGIITAAIVCGANMRLIMTLVINVIAICQANIGICKIASN